MINIISSVLWKRDNLVTSMLIKSFILVGISIMYYSCDYVILVIKDMSSVLWNWENIVTIMLIEFHSCGLQHNVLFLRPSHSCDQRYFHSPAKSVWYCHKLILWLCFPSRKIACTSVYYSCDRFILVIKDSSLVLPTYVWYCHKFMLWLFPQECIQICTTRLNTMLVTFLWVLI